MQYKLTEQNGDLYFECVNGGVGSLKPRLVKTQQVSKTNGIGAIDLLDRMESRHHLKYSITYGGNAVSLSEWDDLVESEDFVLGDVDFEIESDLDVMTLCGFAAVCASPYYSGDFKKKQNQKYKKPTSKKEVKSSWLYQA
jgi:hypothetical protein